MKVIAYWLTLVLSFCAGIEAVKLHPMSALLFSLAALAMSKVRQ
jgi:hypothetical protein